MGICVFWVLDLAVCDSGLHWFEFEVAFVFAVGILGSGIGFVVTLWGLTYDWFFRF